MVSFVSYFICWKYHRKCNFKSNLFSLVFSEFLNSSFFDVNHQNIEKQPDASFFFQKLISHTANFDKKTFSSPCSVQQTVDKFSK